MADSRKPYIAACPLCEQGFVRAAVCENCQQIVGICDECEAIWKEAWILTSRSRPKPDGQHPLCPSCQQETEGWNFLSEDDLNALGLSYLIGGHSP